MGVLNEERLALYDSLIKKYCLNHNDLLTKIYEISYFDGEWCCDDDSFFDNTGNKVVIAYFPETIYASENSDMIRVWCRHDYCDSYGRWPWPDDNYYEDKRQLYIYYNGCIAAGYTFLFSTENSNDYKALSHQPYPEIDSPGCDCDDTDGVGFTPPPVYTATQGWDIYGEGYGFAAVEDYGLFDNRPDLFILHCNNNIEVAFGMIGYPDDNCSYGYNGEYATSFRGTSTIPQGYNLFIKSEDGYYVLISSQGTSGGGGSGTALPSGSEGQFMVYTSGRWQGKTITVGGSY